LIQKNLIKEDGINQEIDSRSKNLCKTCKSTNIIEDSRSGEIICADCGFVLHKKSLSLRQDWRAYSFAEQQNRSRSGYALSTKIYDKGLSTTFNSRYDSKGKKLDPKTRSKMNRLKHHNQRAKVNESWMRNLKIALSEINRICNKLHLPDHVHQKAAQIYRKILGENLVKGRSIDGFVAASIYAACREKRVPRSINDVALISSRSEHDVKYHYRLIVNELDFKPPIDRPTKFISSLSSKLDLSGFIEEYSMGILREARERRLVVGKNPRGVAAAVLYLACQENGVKISQAEVAREADTSEVTMRKRFKEYEPFLVSHG
jgi:transcription initiation factor TFIIB